LNWPLKKKENFAKKITLNLHIFINSKQFVESKKWVIWVAKNCYTHPEKDIKTGLI